MIAMGMMSGTSADGIDVAAIEIGDEPSPRVRVLPQQAHYDYPPELRERVLRAASGDAVSAYEIAAIHGELGDAYAQAASAFIATLPSRPELIAVHGQTVAHLARRATLQIGDTARVAVRTGITTIDDFRSADMAAGGEGAPLVPFGDFVMFASRAPIALLNLGGIANLTLIPTKRREDVTAFDTGPADILSDLIARRSGRQFDDGGVGAGRGRVHAKTLEWALANPYFARRPPKSTGREDFGQELADEVAGRVARDGGTNDDALATAVALTVRTVADALARETPKGVAWRELAVAGGGARNATLIAELRRAIAPTTLVATDELGVPTSSREAIAFAILGAHRLRGLPNTLPSATGASRAVSGGAIHRP